MNVLNVDWWISWITDSKQCIGWNPEAGTVQHQGQIKELFVGVKPSTFSLPQSGHHRDGNLGFLPVPGSPVKIFRMVDCRTRLLEHSQKCVVYVTLYLSLRATRLRHPSVPCCPFTLSLHYRVSQKLSFWSLWMHYICNFVSLLCSLIVIIT